MSNEFDAVFEMARAARRIASMNRIRSTTKSYLQRYRDMLGDFKRDRLDRFIPEEIVNLQRSLERAEDSLNSDPATARDISRQIQNSIHGMRRYAREVQLQQERAEEGIRREQAEKKEADRSTAMTAYYDAVKKISGASVQNFARKELAEIRKQVESGALTSVSAIESKIAKVKENAEVKATQWKKQALETAKKESLVNQISETKAVIGAENFDETEKQKVFQSLDALLGHAQNVTEATEIQEGLSKIEESAEEEIVAEEVRKTAVRAMVKILRSQGFELSPDSVTLVERDGESVVKISCSKANGKHSEVYVTDKGKVRYRFDKYEGSTCLKDIEAFEKDLEKVYSIKITDKKEIWKNPDMLGKDAFDLPDSNRRNA